MDALVHRLDVVALGLLRGDPLDTALLHQPGDALQREVGVDGARAVADERGVVVRLARLARLQDEAHLDARALADEVVVHGGDRQQAGDGRVVAVDAAVAQDKDGRPVLDVPATPAGAPARWPPAGRRRCRRRGRWWRWWRP